MSEQGIPVWSDSGEWLGNAVVNPRTGHMVMQTPTPAFARRGVRAACGEIVRRISDPRDPVQWAVAVSSVASDHVDADEVGAPGHALMIDTGDEELYAQCQCGQAEFGAIRPDGDLQDFFHGWERHVMFGGFAR